MNGTLEVITIRGESAVLVDGKYIIRHTTLAHALAKATIRPYGHAIGSHCNVVEATNLREQER